MVTEGFEEYYKMSKNFLSPMNDISKTVWNLCRRASQGSLEMVSDNLNRGAQQLKHFSAVKRPEELLQLQKECLQENISAWMSNAQKLTNLSMSYFEEINKSFSSNISNMKDQQQNGVNPGGAKGTEKTK